MDRKLKYCDAYPSRLIRRKYRRCRACPYAFEYMASSEILKSRGRSQIRTSPSTRQTESITHEDIVAFWW